MDLLSFAAVILSSALGTKSRRRAAALEPQMATPGLKDLQCRSRSMQFSSKKIQFAAMMAQAPAHLKNPVGYRVLVSAAMSSYSNLQYGYGQAKPLCLPSMHYVGSGGPSHTRVKLGGG